MTNTVNFPNETPEYRRARTALLDAEATLREQVETVASLRRQLPLGGVAANYVFESAQGPVALADLFSAGKSSLLIYSLMYKGGGESPCPMCTTFLDGAHAQAQSLNQRINFAVVARAPLGDVQTLAQDRGWQGSTLLSAAQNTFPADYHSETPDGQQMPMCHTFVKRGEEVFHFWSSELLFAPSSGNPRHMDQMWSLWHFFDLTPEGRGDWVPALTYPS